LAFAYREAELRNVELHAVHAWQLPTQWFPRYAPEKWLRGEVERDAHKYVHEFLGRKEAPHWLKVRVIQGHPAAVLLAKAEEAQLLVVGSRGRSGVKPLLLGSVSSACVHHASCPVAVVRARTSGSS
jgi:nucleotide-binding universal stress UspA family protein